MSELAKRELGGPRWKIFGGTKRNKVEQLNWRGFFEGGLIELFEMARDFAFGVFERDGFTGGMKK